MTPIRYWPSMAYEFSAFMFGAILALGCVFALGLWALFEWVVEFLRKSIARW